MSEINSNKQRILITGVSGLVGRILFNYLIKTYPNKYEIFGLDQHTEISSRYNSNDQHLKFPLSLDNFYQCDITDRKKLFEIIQKLNIQIIIHLAAILECEPDFEKLKNVNINGTKNIFEAPGVQRIIYASSVMTVFGYINQEPYRSIVNETFDDKTMLKNLRKINVQQDLPLPDIQTPGCEQYSKSKIIGEQMAMDIVKNTSKSIICARFGAIAKDDQSGDNWYRTVWLSHADLCQFIDKALQAPLNISGIYFVVSNNHRLWLDLDNAKQDLNFIPQDGAK